MCSNSSKFVGYGAKFDDGRAKSKGKKTKETQKQTHLFKIGELLGGRHGADRARGECRKGACLPLRAGGRRCYFSEQCDKRHQLLGPPGQSTAGPRLHRRGLPMFEVPHPDHQSE